MLSGVLHVQTFQTKKGHRSRCVLCHDDMMKIIHSPDEDYHPYYILLYTMMMMMVMMMMMMNVVGKDDDDY